MIKQNKRLQKGDEVLVIAGNDKGKVGKVLARQDERILIEGVNMRKKGMKKSEQHPEGGFVNFEAPIHISNVMLHVDGVRRKLKAIISEEKGKELVYQENGKSTVHRIIKKSK